MRPIGRLRGVGHGGDGVIEGLSCLQTLGSGQETQEAVGKTVTSKPGA